MNRDILIVWNMWALSIFFLLILGALQSCLSESIGRFLKHGNYHALQSCQYRKHSRASFSVISFMQLLCVTSLGTIYLFRRNNVSNPNNVCHKLSHDDSLTVFTTLHMYILNLLPTSLPYLQQHIFSFLVSSQQYPKKQKVK